MKVIFLDIDGVLNSEKFYRECHKNGIPYDHDSIDPEAAKKILYIIEKTGARIVITSSWRLYDYKSTIDSFRNKPMEVLVPYIIGVTQRSDKTRGFEVMWTLCQWKREIEESRICNGFEKPDAYVIIDDDTDFGYAQRYNFIHTDYQVGLTDEQTEEAVEILNDFKGYLHKKKTEEFIEWMKERPQFTDPESVPEIPNVGKELVDKYIVPVMIEHGAIPKDKLEVGKTYIGTCRNTSKATWNGDHFIYERYKWGSRYNESINHFQDDDGYDVFIPIVECDD